MVLKAGSIEWVAKLPSAPMEALPKITCQGRDLFNCKTTLSGKFEPTRIPADRLMR